jgi:hypothetical protein
VEENRTGRDHIVDPALGRDPPARVFAAERRHNDVACNLHPAI